MDFGLGVAIFAGGMLTGIFSLIYLLKRNARAKVEL